MFIVIFWERYTLYQIDQVGYLRNAIKEFILFKL